MTAPFIATHIDISDKPATERRIPEGRGGPDPLPPRIQDCEHQVSRARELRLLGLCLIIAGSLGTWATLAGVVTGIDASALFPTSVAIGIVVIVANRPRKRRRPRA